MMYHNDTIVFIQGQDRKPLREHDHSRKDNVSNSTIYIPFNTEYSIKFKFKDGIRRRLELYIDGTLITKDLIVSNGSELERFVNSATKFKFVRATHPAVSDPDSEDNGRIEIKLYPEFVFPVQKPVFKSLDWNIQPYNNYSNILRSNHMYTSVSCSYSDPGATVEGSKSDQEFETTTWFDLGKYETFIFNLKGLSNKKSVTRFCTQCGSKPDPKDKFCSDCGNKLK
jgi:hypothetical protein